MDMAVKFEDGSDSIIRGLAFPYGDDLSGETFTKDTNLCEDWFPDGRPLLYHHGLDGKIKTEVVGRQVAIEDPVEEGRWIKGQLDKRSAYYQRVSRLIAKKGLSFSTGAMPHLVEMDGPRIKTWPWIETSFTPTPAHPGAAVYAVKADHSSLTNFFHEDDGSETEPFDVQASRVTDGLRAYLDRGNSRLEARVKAGRELSESNREELRRMLAAVVQVADMKAAIQSLLERTDPDARKSMEALEAELLISEMRRAGIHV